MKRSIKLSVLTLALMAAAFPAMANVSTGDSRYTDPSTVENRGALSRAETVKADNTALNARDRSRESLTPLNQGTSRADIEMTAAIRKAIMADPRLSTHAENVKIITLNGAVTLRGPVKTAEEKKTIDEIAGRLAHSGYVDNQLDVISNT